MTGVEIKDTDLELVQRKKDALDLEMDEEISVALITDMRPCHIHKSGWFKYLLPHFSCIRYSRLATLFLTNPADVTNLKDLLWMPDWFGQEKVTAADRLFVPYGASGCGWMLTCRTKEEAAKYGYIYSAL